MEGGEYMPRWPKFFCAAVHSCSYYNNPSVFIEHKALSVIQSHF